MKLVSEVIQEGVQAFKDRIPYYKNPYEHLSEEDCVVDAFHGPHKIGKARIEICFCCFWNVGWDMGQKMSQSETSVA